LRAIVGALISRAQLSVRAFVGAILSCALKMGHPNKLDRMATNIAFAPDPAWCSPKGV